MNIVIIGGSRSIGKAEETAGIRAASTASPNGRSVPMLMPSGRNASLWGSVYRSSIRAALLPRPERNLPKKTGLF